MCIHYFKINTEEGEERFLDVIEDFIRRSLGHRHRIMSVQELQSCEKEKSGL